VWARYQAQGTAFAAGAAHGAATQISGFALGAELTPADRWLLGIGGGYTNGRLTLDGLAESSDYTAPRAFGYVGYAPSRWVAHVGASLARSSYAVDRTFAFTARLPEVFGGAPIFSGVDREAISTPAGLATDVWGDWALPFRLRAWAVRPSAGLRYARYARRAWTESGADMLSLSAPAQAIASAQADVGVRVARARGRFRPSASAAYRRELTEGRTSTLLQLSDRADGVFVVDGLLLARDTLTARTGFMLQVDYFDLALAYEARHAPHQTRHGIQFSVGF
jgi:uncharacterized protein with beta-barrel porin domain